ncbi:hypothetical protein DL446_26150, partial [Shigella flexneri]|nr:hypothetical protein [Shigella flexneri]
PIPKLHKYEQHLDKQINGLFSTLLTINDNSLRAKAEIASRIIDFLEAKVVNFSFDDILKYKQEFKKYVINNFKSLQHPLYTIKFKNGQQCLKMNS